MKYATTHEAKTHLSKLLREVKTGETYVILNGRTPVGQLIPFTPVARQRPKAGTITAPGTKATDDAFSPLTDEQLEEWGL